MNVLPVDQGGAPIYGGRRYEDVDPFAVEQAPTRNSPLVRLMDIARKRRWWILSSVVAALIAGLVLTLLVTPMYTASTTIEIQRETQNFTNVEGAAPQEAGPAIEFYETQYGLLKARSLAERVAVALKLPDSESFFRMYKSPRVEDWFADGRVISTASRREDRIRAVASILRANIEITPQRASRLIVISFSSPDAAFSKQVADAWASHFIQATLQRKYQATSYARTFLEDRLAQLRTRIDQSERQLVSYAAREGIVTLPAATSAADGSSSPERSLAVDDLASLNSELAKASAERIAAQSRRGSAGGDAVEALANPAITSLRAQRADLQAQYAKLISQFEPEYPPARALQNQIRQIDRAIGAEESRVRRSIDENYRAAAAREEQLAARVETLKAGVLDQRRRSIEYNVLQREVDTNRQLYDALLQRYKEIGVAGGVGANNIAIVDQAQRPGVPSSPSLPRNMLIALVFGLAIGVGIAFLLEQLNDSVDDPAEIAEALGVPLLGTLPKVAEGNVIEALADPKEVLTEAYFSLRTTLSFATDHGFPRSLAVTSSRPAEGKSTTSYAIAASLARPERRVLLVDADMRSPSLHGIVGVNGAAGLSNYLSGATDIHALIQPTPQAGLFVLPAGPQPPSAADLLSGDRFEQLVALLTEHFDHVIVDAPPVMGLADAPLIASRVEGCVFVIEAHATGKSVARVAISRLGSANARMLGVIVSMFDTKRAHYGYGYDYSYGYGYGSPKEPAGSA